MSKSYQNSYWNHKGKHEALVKKLQKLIPNSGECPNADSDNQRLDIFRRASNCYYDLFNNGLCNRAREFEEVFGFLPVANAADEEEERHGSYVLPDGFDFENETLNRRLNAALDKMILKAAKEQGLIKN